MTVKLLIILCAVSASCTYPRYSQWRNPINKISNAKDIDSQFAISSYHLSSASRKGSYWLISDTLAIDLNIQDQLNEILPDSLFQLEKLHLEPSLNELIDPRIRWKRKRLHRYMQDQTFARDMLVPIICYNVSFSSEREGGGMFFSSPTGNDRYIIAREVYVAFYKHPNLVYLNNAVLWDEKIVPAGTPITHEFPQAVLDTLMHMALEPLLKQMDKTAAKQKKR